MANPMPVLPLVGSTIVPPAASRPSASALADHRETNAIFYASTGVQRLELGDDARGARGTSR
jgi:hypothetical protein